MLNHQFKHTGLSYEYNRNRSTLTLGLDMANSQGTKGKLGYSQPNGGR